MNIAGRSHQAEGLGHCIADLKATDTAEQYGNALAFSSPVILVRTEFEVRQRCALSGGSFF